MPANAQARVGMTWAARPLSPEDLSQTPKDAPKASGLSTATLATAKERAQQATQARSARVAVLFAENGKQAGGNGSEDVAHRIGRHTRFLRDATQHVAKVTAEDVAQNLATISQVGDFQVVDDVACATGMVTEGLGQGFGAARCGGVFLHGTQEGGQRAGDNGRDLFGVDFEVVCDGADGIIAGQCAEDVGDVHVFMLLNC